MDNFTKTTHVPPVFGDLIVGFTMTSLFLLGHIYIINNPQMNHNGAIPTWIITGFLVVLLTICTIFIGGKHYSFDCNNITVRILGIPIRTVSWKSVSHAIYARKWRESGKVRYVTAVSSIKGNAIFVSLYACPPFDPEYDVRPDFALIHPRTFLSIYLPAKDTDRYIEVFRYYFPELIVPQECNDTPN